MRRHTRSADRVGSAERLFEFTVPIRPTEEPAFTPLPFHPHNGSIQPPKEAERDSWSDYLTWPEGERYELIDGIAYAMSPAPRRRHQETSRAIFRQIDGSLAGQPCEAYFAPFDVKLSADEDDDAPTVVQPDITVTGDRSKLTEQGMTGPPGFGDRDRLPR